MKQKLTTYQATETLLTSAIKASLKAGDEIMKVYEGEFQTELKGDGSPITLADKNANKTIINILKVHSIPIISEETKLPSWHERKSYQQYWLVDPLDGTKEFVNRNGEFTVNIALMQQNKPIMGIIYAPVQRILYFAHINKGAFKYQLNSIEKTKLYTLSLKDIYALSEKISTQNPTDTIIVPASRSHLDTQTMEYLEKLKKSFPKIEIASKGSSLKFCMLAEGKAHFYPRPSRIWEWDTAAGHAILEAAGGCITYGKDEKEFVYNKEFLQNDIFFAYASRDLFLRISQ